MIVASLRRYLPKTGHDHGRQGIAGELRRRADVKAMFGLTTVHGTFRLQSGQVSIGADPSTSSVQASIAASGEPG